jgi:Arc/MetJ family transcription regulator
MAKHLVDIDERALREAQAQMRTGTIRDTVNEALRRVGSDRRQRVNAALETLATAELLSREDAWR